MQGYVDSTGNIQLVLTAELIHECSTKRGGFTKAQLEFIGITWPPKAGWLKERIGTTMSLDKFNTFKELGK